MPIHEVTAYRMSCDWCKADFQEDFCIFEDRTRMVEEAGDSEWCISDDDSVVLCPECATPDDLLIHDKYTAPEDKEMYDGQWSRFLKWNPMTTFKPKGWEWARKLIEERRG